MYNFSKIDENEKEVLDFLPPQIDNTAEFKSFSDFSSSGNDYNDGENDRSFVSEPSLKSSILHKLNLESVLDDSEDINTNNLINETNVEEDSDEDVGELVLNDLSKNDVVIEEIDEDELANSMNEVNQILKLANERASKIIEEANAKADSILKENEAKIKILEEKALNEARTTGFSQGYEEGMSKASEDIREELTKEKLEFSNYVNDFVNDIENRKKAIVDEYIDNLTELALVTAEKITKISLSSSGSIISNMISEQIQDMSKTAWIKIYLSKYDYRFIQEAGEDIIDLFTDISDNVRVVVMEDSELGTAIVETEDEVIDLSLSTQLDNAREIIKNTL